MQENPSIIEIEHVTRQFRDIKAVDNLSLTLGQGEFLALLGPNGAGKTTLVEMIEGLQEPTSGTITILGQGWNGNRAFLNRQIGISLQETRFIDKLTVWETLMLFGSFYGEGIQRVNETVELTGLGEKQRSYTVNLSGGQRQKLALGIALLNRPKVLLLDEPTTGLDPSSRREIWKILLDLRRQRQTSLVLTTHYMEEASFLCNTIVIMDKGKILAKGTLHELLSGNRTGEVIEFVSSGFGEPVMFHDLPGFRCSTFDNQSGKHHLLVDEIVTALPVLLGQINGAGHSVQSLECRKMTLEDLFLILTGRKLSENG